MSRQLKIQLVATLLFGVLVGATIFAVKSGGFMSMYFASVVGATFMAAFITVFRPLN